MLRGLTACMRGGMRTVVCAVMVAGAGVEVHAQDAGDVVGATYGDPTGRYDHGILGDAQEWGALILHLNSGGAKRSVRITLPHSRVFEDIAPRLADLDGDGAREVIVVETDLSKGARLAVYNAAGLIAATPFIGRTHRWLAPVGAADLDGDGRIEVAYVDRPHLAKVLRIWRFEAGALRHVVDVPGLTNHQIGWDHIPGGIRDCGHGVEMITADAGWTRVMATSFDGQRAVSRAVGSYDGVQSLARAMECGG